MAPPVGSEKFGPYDRNLCKIFRTSNQRDQMCDSNNNKIEIKSPKQTLANSSQRSHHCGRSRPEIDFGFAVELSALLGRDLWGPKVGSRLLQRTRAARPCPLHSACGQSAACEQDYLLHLSSWLQKCATSCQTRPVEAEIRASQSRTWIRFRLGSQFEL